MATISGITAEKGAEIEGQLISEVKIVNNNLVFKTKNGTTFDAGQVIQEPYKAHPVGSIYMSTSSENPKTYLGGGTWVRWGKGRVPVSLDEDQGEFDTSEETGGNKDIALSKAHMPAHNHGGVTSSNEARHSHTGYTDTAGEHTHSYYAGVNTFNLQVAPGSWNNVTVRPPQGHTSGPAGGHTHAVQTYEAAASHQHSISSEGSGVAFKILQPYITCYMWKRTA